MNHVERFKVLMNFQKVDRLPRWEWAMWWDKTIERWHDEGLPANLTDIFDIHEYFGLDPYKQYWFSTTEATIEAAQHHVEGIVSNMDDYLKHTQYLFPDHSNAIEGMTPWLSRQQQGDAVIWITLEGFFWFPRTMMGFFKLMMAYYDQPELLHKICQDLLEFNLAWIDRWLAMDYQGLHFADDWGSQTNLLIAPDRWRQFFKPVYAAMFSKVKSAGLDVWFHSDGNIIDILPDLIELGVDRILTSGQKNLAPEGMDLIAELVERAGDRVIIMPGAGLEPENIAEFHAKVGANEYHSTLWDKVESKMNYRKPGVYMGGLPEIPEFNWMQTNSEKVRTFIANIGAHMSK